MSKVSKKYFPGIEPLEARIAPALLINGANLLGGADNPSTGETSAGGNSVTLVKVLSGTAVVWYDNGQIYGISVGPNTNLEITGDIYGDIVANLTAAGRLSDSDNNPLNGEDGRVLLPNNILGIKTSQLSSQKGDIPNVITGGSVSNLSISGSISGIYAGDGAFHESSDIVNENGEIVSTLGAIIDFNPIQPEAQTDFVFTRETGVFQAGASIQKAKIATAQALQVIAGSGNPAGAVFAKAAPAGGSIRDIRIENAFTPGDAPDNTASYELIAGDGASGGIGGAGGSIEQVVELSSFGNVRLIGGDGGNGSTGAGGAGGSVVNVDLQSESSTYTLTGGAGGQGAPGGAGGSVRNANLTNRTPAGGVLISADFTGDGLDDILVGDPGSGQMVLNRNLGGGLFEPVVQYFNNQGEAVSLIDAVGITPVDAHAMDADGDGDLDFVVAYKNSDSIGVYLNQYDEENGVEGGVFWNPGLNEGVGGFAATETPLGFTPEKMIPLASGSLAVIETADGKSKLHYLFRDVTDEGGVTFESLERGPTVFNKPVVDVAETSSKLFAALNDGVIVELVFSAAASKTWDILPTRIAVRGGISDLDVDESGQQLLALSTTGKSVTVFQVDESPDAPTPLVPIGFVNLASTGGRPLVAHFLNDGDAGTADKFVVLSRLAAGARADVYAPVIGAPDEPVSYVSDVTFSTDQALKQLLPSYGGPSVGFVALAGSLSKFVYSTDFVTSTDVPLPFASKRVFATAGVGGNGLDIGKKLGAGGNGGSIFAINADAQEIFLTAGNGGQSQNGPGGHGGDIENPASFVAANGGSVSPRLLADSNLLAIAGDGGSPQGAGGKTASGGSGGSFKGLTIELSVGDSEFQAGDGGTAKGGTGGAGGGFLNMKTTSEGGNLKVTAGNGGSSTSGTGNGGHGGAIVNWNHEQLLTPDTEDLEEGYAVIFIGGDAGSSVGGMGGSGGSITGAVIKMDGSDRTYFGGGNPPQVDAHRDNTVRIDFTAGDGASGKKGGVGGHIKDLNYQSYYDQEFPNGSVEINYVTMSLVAGNGGNATGGNGGDGGSVTLSKPISGVTNLDPDAETPSNTGRRVGLYVRGGDAGDGSAKGGHGGSVTGLVVQNAQFFDGRQITGNHLASAYVVGGNGGDGGTSDGGRGGSIVNALLGVQGTFHEAEPGQYIFFDGYLDLYGGQGGNGGTAQGATTGRGGQGGGIIKSEVGLVSSYSYAGMFVVGGDGGAGRNAGGVGGGVSELRINVSQSSQVPSILVYAGDGGAASGNGGVGGLGGSIDKIFQTKDINSSINLLQAGNGGDSAAGKAGNGGNVTNVRSSGFIGRPSAGGERLGIFDTYDNGTDIIEFAQGLYSGRAGTGVTAGTNGFVSNIVARQIAAIAAAVDDDTQTFAAVAKVTNVKTDSIGYEATGPGLTDNVFDWEPGVGTTPAQRTPIDGFIFSATTPVGVTGMRTGFIFAPGV